MEAGAYINRAGVLSHNPLHDLESLWWVGVWFLLCHYPPSNLQDITVQQHIEVVKKYGDVLFNNHNDTLSRRQALTGPDLLAKIQPLSFPKAVQHLIVLLDLFRDQLVVHYELYKPTMTSQDLSFFNPDLYCRFSDLVEEAIMELKDDATALWLFHTIGKSISYMNSKK